MFLSMVLPLPLCLLKMDGVSVVIYQHAGTVVPLNLADLSQGFHPDPFGICIC